MKKIIFLLLTFATITPCISQIITDQSNLGESTTKSLVDNLQTCMQTIIAGNSGYLVKVAVEIETQDCPYPIFCKILNGSPSDTLLAYEFIMLPINSPRGLQEFTFSNPPQLIEGQTYTIVLKANCISGPGQSTFWYKSVTNAYTNGQSYNQFETTIQPEDAFNDFYFTTYLDVSNKLNEIDKIKMNLFPNPSSSGLTVTLNTEEAIIEILNSSGQTIQKLSVKNGHFYLNTYDLPTGLYLIIANTKSGKAKKIFIKQ